MRTAPVLAIALFVGGMMLSSASQGAEQLPDGVYACTMGVSVNLGDIWIKGDTYVGPSFEASDPAYPFTITQSGTINWGGPLNGLDSGGNSVVSTVIQDLGGGRRGFSMIIDTGSDEMHEALCDPDF